jgi:hypothetical protein
MAMVNSCKIMKTDVVILTMLENRAGVKKNMSIFYCISVNP